MGNRSIFGFTIEVIFLALGIYVIAINLIRLQSATEFFDVVSSDINAYNFDGWHNYKSSNFRGFTWFIGRFESFPGLHYMKETIHDVINHVPNFTEDVGDNIIQIFKYMLTIIVVPFRGFGSIIIDVFICITWFFTFLG